VGIPSAQKWEEEEMKTRFLNTYISREWIPRVLNTFSCLKLALNLEFLEEDEDELG
jgi:hypothetical protein